MGIPLGHEDREWQYPTFRVMLICGRLHNSPTEQFLQVGLSARSAQRCR
jgi:hypothetical protein